MGPRPRRTIIGGSAGEFDSWSRDDDRRQSRRA
jgi:hypothetical protein